MPYIKNGAFAGFKSKQSPEDKDQNLSAVQGTGVAYTGGTQGAASYGQTNAGAGDLGGGNGRFINFSRYFDQNKAGATAMADSLGNKAQKTAQEAGKAVNAQNQAFRSAADAGTVQYRGETVRDDTPQRAATSPLARPAGLPLDSAASGQDVNASNVFATSPNAPLSNPNAGRGLQTPAQNQNPFAGLGKRSLSEIQALAGQTYSGPQSLTDFAGYADVSGAVDKANSAVNGLQSFEGIQTGLQDEYGKQGSYTQGDSLFDAALAQNAGAGKFADLKKKYSGLSGALADSMTNAQNYANAAKNTSATNAGKYGLMANKHESALAAAEEENKAAQARSQQATDDYNATLAAQEQASKDKAAGQMQAKMDGLENAWISAGAPVPYADWKKTYLAQQAGQVNRVGPV